MKKLHFGVPIITLVLLIVIWYFVSESTMLKPRPACDLGCWRTIRIGSDKVLAIKNLKEMKDIESLKERDLSTPDEIDLRVFFEFTKSDNYGELFFENGKVDAIILDIGERLPLRKVTEVFGEPGYIVPTYAMEGTKTIISTFIYPEKGICLVAQTMSIPPIMPFSALPVFISPTNQVKRIGFFNISAGDWYAEQCVFKNGDRYLQLWNGYFHQYQVNPD